MADDPLELTILMPCLNEAETLGACIDKAQDFLARGGIAGEVLIADNGSTDGSQHIAGAHGARLAVIETRGYGAALAGGIARARGRYIIMGDADGSYDFADLDAFVTALREGHDLVMGNRFAGGIHSGAMPWLHRYVGNPALTFAGRLFFNSPVRDFHCGLRGFSREAVRGLNLRTTGMEFASEMVVKATLSGLKVTEVPTTLSPDGRSRRPHLRSFRDGWRHLRFLLLFSPRWLFLYPGLVLLVIGLFGTGLLMPGPVEVAPGIELDIHTLLVAAMCVLLGLQSISFALIGRNFATRYGFIPRSARFGSILDLLSLERILVVAIMLMIGGLAGLGWAVARWVGTGFGSLAHADMTRLMIASMTATVAGLQLMMTGFLSSMINIPLYERRITDAPQEPPARIDQRGGV